MRIHCVFLPLLILAAAAAQEESAVWGRESSGEADTE